MNILQELYDSEIDFEISTDSPVGFRVRLGHQYTGKFRLDQWAATFDEAVEHLRKAALRQFPDSKFSKDYKAKVDA